MPRFGRSHSGSSLASSWEAPGIGSLQSASFDDDNRYVLSSAASTPRLSPSMAPQMPGTWSAGDKPVMTPCDLSGGLPPPPLEAPLLEAIEEAVDDHDWGLPHIGRTPAWNIAVNMLVYMAAPMSMPATLASAGWGWGTAFLLYSAFITLQTALIIGEICVRCPQYDTYPSLSAACFEKFALRQNWSGHGGRQVGFWVAITMQFLTYYLDSTAQCLYVAQYMDQLMPNSPICIWKWLLFTWVAAIPLVQIPTFHESRWIAAATLVAIAFVVLTFFYEVMDVTPWDCNPGPKYTGITTKSVLLSFSAFAYAFGGHGMFPEEIREMESPESWPTVVYGTYAVILPMYFACACVGYYAYGSFANANINLNFPDNTVNTLSIIVQLVFTYYCIFGTSLVIMLHIEATFLGITPTAIWQRQSFGVPAVVVRFTFRSLFIGTQVGLCELLLGGDGDTLLAMQSLAGAVGMAAFTYFLPFLFHWELFGDELSTPRKVWYSVNIIVGVAVCVGGLISAVIDLSDLGGVDQQCHLGYAYSPLDPEDPCYNQTLPAGWF